MNKLIAFFLVMVVGVGMLTGIMAGGGGIVTTDLTAAVNASDTTLLVLTTTDFLSEDWVQCGDERIYYTTVNGTAFLGCTRGYDDTTAAYHAAGARIYTRQASTINTALGFNMLATQDQWGWAAIIMIPLKFFIVTIPYITKLMTDLLTGDLAVIAWFWYAMVAGFVITLALAIISARRIT